MAEDLDAIDGPVGSTPEEREELARQVGEDLTDVFLRYVRGELPFEDVTFLTHDALEDIFFIARGDYATGDEDEDEWEEDAWGDEDEVYDLDEATAEQEELAQEPERDA